MSRLRCNFQLGYPCPNARCYLPIHSFRQLPPRSFQRLASLHLRPRITASCGTQLLWISTSFRTERPLKELSSKIETGGRRTRSRRNDAGVGSLGESAQSNAGGLCRLNLSSGLSFATEKITAYLRMGERTRPWKASGSGFEGLEVIRDARDDVAAVFACERPARGRRRVQGGWRPGKARLQLLGWPRRAFDLSFTRLNVGHTPFPFPVRSPQHHGSCSSRRLSAPPLISLTPTSLRTQGPANESLLEGYASEQRGRRGESDRLGTGRGNGSGLSNVDGLHRLKYLLGPLVSK